MGAVSKVPMMNDFSEKLKSSKKSLWWAGFALCAVGVISLFFPIVTTASITFFVGSLLIVTGLIGFFNSFSVSGTGPFFGSLLFSLLKVACGVIVFANPLIGMVYLTSVVAFLFMLEGAFEISFAFELKPEEGWGWCLFSGIVSILSSIVIIFTLTTSSLWLVGMIFGINTLSTGVALFLTSKSLPAAEAS